MHITVEDPKISLMNGDKENFLRFRISTNLNCFNVTDYQSNLFVIQLKFKSSFSNDCSKKQMGKD